MDQWNIQSNHILSPDILCRQLGIIQTPFVGKLLCLRFVIMYKKYISKNRIT